MVRLKLNKKFQPCSADEGEELYRNGIFEFNITRLLAFIEAHREQFEVESITVADIPDHGGAHLEEKTVCAADLSRPILLAEISPGQYNVIDGNHRLGKARRERVQCLPAHRIHCPRHVPFLTSVLAYERYVEYWNSKVKDRGGR
jgi:hypothetical protein